MTTIDYRVLLKKYIAHVGEEEGVTFTNYLGEEFSSEEKAELQRLAKEVQR